MLGDAEGPDLTWVSEEACDRGLSRQVRSFIRKEVYPKLSIAPNELPSTCQLHPDQDMYADHENHKQWIGSVLIVASISRQSST